MTRTLEIGALCASISRQLDGLVSAEDADQLDRDNVAINRCYVMGYMPDSATARARKKLLAKCQKAVSKHAQSNTEGSHGRSGPLAVAIGSRCSPATSEGGKEK